MNEESFRTLPLDDSRLTANSRGAKGGRDWDCGASGVSGVSGFSQPTYLPLPKPTYHKPDGEAVSRDQVAALARETETYTQLLRRFRDLGIPLPPSHSLPHSLCPHPTPAPTCSPQCLSAHLSEPRRSHSLSDVEEGRTSAAERPQSGSHNRSSVIEYGRGDVGVQVSTNREFPHLPESETTKNGLAPHLQSHVPLPPQGWAELNATGGGSSVGSSVRLSPTKRAHLEALGRQLQRDFARSQTLAFTGDKSRGPRTSSPKKGQGPILRPGALQYPTTSSSADSNPHKAPTFPPPRPQPHHKKSSGHRKSRKEPSEPEQTSPRRPYSGSRPPFATDEEEPRLDNPPLNSDYDELRARLGRLREDMGGKKENQTPVFTLAQSPPKPDRGVFLEPVGLPLRKSKTTGRSESRGRQAIPDRKPEAAFVPARAAMPFVAGQSTGKTFSLSGNLQTLLATLKTNCPLLHQAYMRHAKDASPVQIQELFENELEKAIEKASRKVDRMLGEYETRASSGSFSSRDKAEALVSVESAYSQLQRLRGQRTHLLEASTKIAGWRARPAPTCKEALNKSLNSAVPSPRKSGVRAETVSSVLHRSVSTSELGGRERGESARRRLVGAQALRDIRHLSKALSPRT